MKTINTKTLKQTLKNNENIVFLNVLSEEQYQKEHIPGSENIPYDADDFVEQAAQKAPDKSSEIIVYCANEDCSASEKAAKKLEDAGYTNVKDYEGGMKEWKESDNEVRSAA